MIILTTIFMLSVYTAFAMILTDVLTKKNSWDILIIDIILLSILAFLFYLSILMMLFL